jgi:hypothetical protein
VRNILRAYGNIGTSCLRGYKKAMLLTRRIPALTINLIFHNNTGNATQHQPAEFLVVFVRERAAGVQPQQLPAAADHTVIAVGQAGRSAVIVIERFLAVQVNERAVQGCGVVVDALPDRKVERRVRFAAFEEIMLRHAAGYGRENGPVDHMAAVDVAFVDGDVDLFLAGGGEHGIGEADEFTDMKSIAVNDRRRRSDRVRGRSGIVGRNGVVPGSGAVGTGGEEEQRGCKKEFESFHHRRKVH